MATFVRVGYRLLNLDLASRIYLPDALSPAAGVAFFYGDEKVVLSGEHAEAVRSFLDPSAPERPYDAMPIGGVVVIDLTAEPDPAAVGEHAVAHGEGDDA